MIKFFAVILITNSHMDYLYPEGLSILATGGAIGDAFFFFCSGFTLFLKPMGRFDSWYKKRINRIYPTVFACAILTAFVFGVNNDMRYVLLHGGGWFVSCIMIYYIILYVINKKMSEHLNLAFCISGIIVLVSYILWEKPPYFSLYGHTYFKWILFFLVMLQGAIIGKKYYRMNTKKAIVLLFVSILLYYAVIIISQRCEMIKDISIMSIIPLLSIMLCTYKICNSNKVKLLLNNKYINRIIMFVGGLCLEIYLIQIPLLKLELGLPFPVNYFVMFILIISSAYILRCCARIFSQTFNKDNYNWFEVFKAI